LDARRFLPLQKVASQMWDAVPGQLDADIELVRTGGFTVAETDDQVQDLKQKGGWEAEFGIVTELLDEVEAHAALPALGPTVRAVTWCAEDGYANPLLATAAYIEAARRHGAQVHPRRPITALRRASSGWRATAGDQQVHVGAVVNAAGPWLSEITALTGVALQMAPLAIQMHATVRTKPVLRNLVQHIGEGLSIKQVASGTVLIGGGWPSRAMTGAGRTAASADSIFGNAAQAVRILPFLGSLRLLRAWAGPLAATPDEMPIVGAVPGLDDFYLAGCTYSFTFAPLWGATLADLVEGHRPPVDLAGIEPGRLVPPTNAEGASSAHDR
jgi:sarcosine oxidase subunit beta